ncbi:hypothetical protein [Clostridium sp.]|uniref:hypothetical protein n=1 Tax=Clostridium sp. TaxID=1506 RepID=UPI0039912806
MKSKKLVLICTATLIGMSTLFVSCGNEKTVSKKIESVGKVESQDGQENKDKEQVENLKNNVENKEEKVDFSKYSDEFLVNFLNEGTEVLKSGIECDRGKLEYFDDKEACYNELVRGKESIKKRQELINKYYAPGVYEEEYIDKDGKTYLKNWYYEDHMPYEFHSVKSREVTGNNSLKVRFNVSFLYGYPVIDKNIKTVEFKEVNGELKAASYFEERSMINAIENKDESKPCLDDKQKEFFDYVNKNLDGILRDDQIVSGISERYYDEGTDSKYYGVSITEPTQSAVCYFVNTKNGSIYGHYEGRFVVAPKQ